MKEQIGSVTLDFTYDTGAESAENEQVEETLLALVKNYAEVEYARLIEESADWRILYQLSPIRGNAVDWIPMSTDAKVLEVGSGCGAVTGVLLKKAGQVVCTETSKRQSMVNAHRHSESENLTIYVGNFVEMEKELPSDFDFIFLTGAFDCIKTDKNSEKQYEELLSAAFKHLAPGGRIVFSVDNQYGLKYFAGCKEEHTGEWFSGIENYTEGGMGRNFSRKRLEKLLVTCGVKKYNFYYPYPDYKFMTTLYSDEYLPGKGELSNNIRNFDRDRMLLFDEKYAFDGIVEDNLFSVFANSYTVIIGEGFDVKYVKYSNDRMPEYQIRTEIRRDERGNAEVRKYPLCESAAEHIRGMAAAYESLLERYEGGNLAINKCSLHEENGEIWDSFEFLAGKPLSEMLDECLEKNDIEGFHALFRQYVEKTGYNQTFPVADFDLIFGNIMVQEDVWTIIDYEWTFGKAVDVKELAFRAIYCYLLEDEKRNKLNLDLILEELGITEEDASYYREQELSFQKFVTGQQKSMAEIRELLGGRVLKPVEWIERITDNSAVSRVQIYEDCGNGFSEEASYFMEESYKNEQEIETEILLDGNVQVLRIDPCMDSCVVKIEEMVFNGKAVPFSNKKLVYSNGKALKAGGGFVFAQTDPNLYIKVNDLDRQGSNILYVKMTVVRLPLSVAADMADSVKKLI